MIVPVYQAAVLPSPVSLAVQRDVSSLSAFIKLPIKTEKYDMPIMCTAVHVVDI